MKIFSNAEFYEEFNRIEKSIANTKAEMAMKASQKDIRRKKFDEEFAEVEERINRKHKELEKEIKNKNNRKQKDVERNILQHVHQQNMQQAQETSRMFQEQQLRDMHGSW